MVRKGYVDWGQPTLQDSTGYWEGIINEVAQEHVDFLETAGPEVQNRPLGSKTISPEDQLSDYLVARNDAQLLDQQYYQPLLAQLGSEEKAALAFTKQIIRLERMLERRNGRTAT